MTKLLAFWFELFQYEDWYIFCIAYLHINLHRVYLPSYNQIMIPARFVCLFVDNIMEKKKTSGLIGVDLIQT